jgi:hypothetical protein
MERGGILTRCQRLGDVDGEGMVSMERGGILTRSQRLSDIDGEVRDTHTKKAR